MGTQVSGIIDKIYVDYNTVVKQGQLIAEMDKVTLESDLASARATYDGAKAAYEYQESLYKRNQTLHEKKLISDTEFEESRYNYLNAKSNFDSSKAALQRAERDLSYATITAPIDGIVISKDVEEGQTVASGFETPTLFTIAADLTQMQVVADVDEADIGGVEEGQRVEFTVDAYPGQTFSGQVTQVRLGESSDASSTSSSSSTVVTYEVVISAPNPDLKLKPRLTANINIYTLDKPGVLAVPAKALRFTPAGPIVGADAVVNDCDAEHKLWTKEGNTFTAHAVETGNPRRHQRRHDRRVRRRARRRRPQGRGPDGRRTQPLHARPSGKRQGQEGAEGLTPRPGRKRDVLSLQTRLDAVSTTL